MLHFFVKSDGESYKKNYEKAQFSTIQKRFFHSEEKAGGDRQVKSDEYQIAHLENVGTVHKVRPAIIITDISCPFALSVKR